ncbi:MAG TPA: hypothetical protein VGR96_03780 [Acidobacteriaceae bacterium]|nr:hypothetical protein [Acidobacteriaceae bacterium]
MKGITRAILASALFVTVMGAQAAVRSRSGNIIVEQPENLPEAAQAVSLAMYLHDTGDGRSLLYLEQNEGRKLVILDVTDPARIRAVAQASIPATGPFDFTEEIGGSATLIRYRDHSGFAMLNLKRYTKPELTTAPHIMNTEMAEHLGESGLLLTTPLRLAGGAAPAREYDIVDTSSALRPALLASVEGVTQRLSKPDTGTVFLLDDHGVTVVRRPRVEEEHALDLLQQRGN